MLSIRVDGAYSGDRVSSPSGNVLEGTKERWNARIGIAWSTWELAAFVRNITNEICNVPEDYTSPYVGHYNTPRAIGLEFVTRF